MSTERDVEELSRTIERQRLRALLDTDLATVASLHADDFQLVNPIGETLTNTEYLAGLASGGIDYRVLEPGSEIAVRVYDAAAVIRCRSKLEIISGGDCVPLARYWHTDLYERRDGQWQVVWSQATVIDA